MSNNATSHYCVKCGYNKFTWRMSLGTMQCRNPSCEHIAPIPVVQSKPADRIRRLAAGRIAADQNCVWQNQCSTFLHGDCHRAEFMAEEYSCPFARVFETQGEGVAA